MPNDVKIGEILQETANAIRDRLNVQQSCYKIKVRDLPQAILDLPEPIPDEQAFDLDSFTDGTLSSVETDAIYIRSSAFYGCGNLVTASFPLCESIGTDVFRLCSALTSFYAPKLTYVPNGTFVGTNLETLDLPACTEVATWAFSAMDNLISLSLPNCEIMGTQPESTFNKLSQLYLPKCRVLYSAFESCRALVEVNLPEITYLESYVFMGCSNLRRVNVPKVFGSIASNAFDACYNLEQINDNNILNCSWIATSAFAFCSKISNIVLPNCKSIETSAFYACGKLESITILDSACYLANSDAFVYTPFRKSEYLGRFGSIYVRPEFVDSYKTKLNWSVYSSRITAIPQELNDYYNNYYIYNGEFASSSELTVSEDRLNNVKIILNSAFYSNQALQSLTLPEAVYIGSRAFYSCQNLIYVALPNVANIDMYAFYKCGHLISASLPSAAAIGSSAFAGCSELRTIDLPQASIINQAAFYDCSNLTSISIPKIQAIKGYAFNNCYNLSQVILPDTLAELGYYTFYRCSNLRSITIPSTITKLSGYCFGSCINLSNITFNGNISSIGEGCFENCAFSSIFMPDLTVLGGSAFYSCRSLTKAVFGKLSSCGYGAFKDCENLEELHIIEFTDQNAYNFFYSQNNQKLSAIYIYGEKMPTDDLNSNLQERIPSCKLYVRNSMLPYYNLDYNWAQLVEAGRVIGKPDEEMNSLFESVYGYRYR